MRYNKRVVFEQETVSLMIRMYCRNMHHAPSLCNACESLRNYAFNRIEKCVLHPSKPVCSECKIHCYKPEMRQQIKEVMRYAGPRMVWMHPAKAITYLWLKYFSGYRVFGIRNNLRS